MTRLTRPFIERHWVVAAAIAFLFGPFAAMLYLGRGRAAAAYLAVEIALGFAVGGILDSPAMGWLATAAVRVVAVVHATVLARHGGRADAWFARWYAVAGLWFLVVVAMNGALAFRIAWIEPFAMQSDALEPVIMRGDRVLVFKRGLDPYPARPGAIVAYRKDGFTYLRRVETVRGDRVLIADGGGPGGVADIPGEAVIGRVGVIWWSGSNRSLQWVRFD